MADDNTLLQPPGDDVYPSIERLPSYYNPLQTFELAKGSQKHYQQQFADIYFLRLAKLKPVVEEAATEAWADFEVANEKVRRVDRVLDVRQGNLCWVVGTIYMDMPLKPNILDDISKDHWISAVPAREKYLSPDGHDQTFLEDESGRLRLVGTPLQTMLLVTGCIVAAMGTENANGDFEAIDIRVADLPRQPQRWERDDSALAIANGDKKRKLSQDHERVSGGKIAIVSGLGISGDEANNLATDLLMEYLLGEACGPSEQQEAGSISRLIIAGNALAEANPLAIQDEIVGKKASKKYGYDAGAYNPAPTAHLDNFLAALLPSIPVTLMPGDSDPANTSLPQQAIHPAMLPHSRAYAAVPGSEGAGWLDSTTNPWEGDIDGWRMIGTGGQPVDDIFKYVEGDDRIEMMENMLRWRCVAPTAPDTLWCYPFQDDDPFVIDNCPHVFFVGNQPKFESVVIDGPFGQKVTLITIPKFKETGEIVLLDSDSLDVKVFKISILDEN